MSKVYVLHRKYYFALIHSLWVRAFLLSTPWVCEITHLRLHLILHKVKSRNMLAIFGTPTCAHTHTHTFLCQNIKSI